MKPDWPRVIAANMEPLSIPGREVPLYKPRGEQGSVWIVTEAAEFPVVSAPLDRILATPGGGRELDLDTADPDFLIVHKTVGMSEYFHYIPWERIVNVFFHSVPD